ncbi:MAG: hypothetical protein KDD65_05100 [Bacteroidetes bacterium]|nr:hypothetical protein [Bacteroidota bacterium]
MNLDRLEEKAFGSLWDDGLIDAISGIGLVGVGAMWYFDLIQLTAALPLILIPAWQITRRRIAIPRAGFVRPSVERQVKSSRRLTQSLAIGLTVLPFFVAAIIIQMRDGGSGTSELLRRLAPAIPTVILGALLFMTAALTGRHAFRLYGLIALVAAFVGFLTGIDPWIQIVALGAIVTAIGGYHVAAFISTHPIREL